MLPAIVLSTVVAGAGVLWLWHADGTADVQITRFGQALSQTLAHTSAADMLQGDRIELTVRAADAVSLPEVAGVVFYNAKNEILAVNGSSDRGPHFTAPATLDDTITGYVSVVLTGEAFVQPIAWWRWLASIALILGAPLTGLFYLNLVNRGNRSLPIVSVPEPTPQPCLCVAVTLHNQMALSRPDMEQAIADAHAMALEASTLHQGLCVTARPRGVLMLFDPETGADQAVNCARLALTLLGEFETNGDFRAAIGQVDVLGGIADQGTLSAQDLDQGTLDTLFTLASLSKRQTLLLSGTVCQQLSQDCQALSQTFDHPLAEDLALHRVYQLTDLPEHAEHWVQEQAGLILGFTQGSLRA